ncbi:MAG: hypothetical protein HRT81_17290 [Henriciella sp.]|nr:hypothetical protein [Henriciella sp.]
MAIPFVAMQATIFVDYWGDFSKNTWAVHVHYWIATAWYLLLISQPWLFANGRMDAHRTWGVLGIGIAGAFAFTSISQLNRDIIVADYVIANPGGIGPFDAWFFMGIMFAEIILIVAFIAAIVMAVIKRHSLRDHAWWLVSTVFIVMFPAMGRGLQALFIAIYGFDPDIDIAVMPPIYIGQVLIILMTVGVAAYLKVLRHPATYLAVAANLSVFLMEPLGRSAFLDDIARIIIKA